MSDLAALMRDLAAFAHDYPLCFAIGVGLALRALLTFFPDDEGGPP